MKTKLLMAMVSIVLFSCGASTANVPVNPEKQYRIEYDMSGFRAAECSEFDVLKEIGYNCDYYGVDYPPNKIR